MTEKTWQTIKIQYCHHVDTDVGLEADRAVSGRAPIRLTIPSPPRNRKPATKIHLITPW
jgi:hypothetical protein